MARYRALGLRVAPGTFQGLPEARGGRVESAAPEDLPRGGPVEAPLLDGRRAGAVGGVRRCGGGREGGARQDEQERQAAESEPGRRGEVGGTRGSFRSTGGGPQYRGTPRREAIGHREARAGGTRGTAMPTGNPGPPGDQCLAADPGPAGESRAQPESRALLMSRGLVERAVPLRKPVRHPETRAPPKPHHLCTPPPRPLPPRSTPRRTAPPWPAPLTGRTVWRHEDPHQRRHGRRHRSDLA